MVSADSNNDTSGIPHFTAGVLNINSITNLQAGQWSARYVVVRGCTVRDVVGCVSKLAPRRGESITVCEDKRGQLSPIENFSRAAATRTRCVAKFKKASLKCIYIKVAVGGCLIDQTFHSLDG